MSAIFRVIFGYCFLVFMVRIVRRRPGTQMTPVEVVLLFLMGGLALAPLIGDDRSLSNALLCIMAICLTHLAIAWLKQLSPRFGRILDGTPLVVLAQGQTEITANMPSTLRIPVKDSPPKVNNEMALGADLPLHGLWWPFERSIWLLFTVLVLLAVLGVFGRGWAAQSGVRAKDGTMDVRYERIERFGTPSIVDVHFGANAIHDGKVQLWLNQRAVKALGAQRVVPQPLSSVMGDDGILYTFAATDVSVSVQFVLQPSASGIFHLELRVPGSQMLTTKVVVMP